MAKKEIKKKIVPAKKPAVKAKKVAAKELPKKEARPRKRALKETVRVVQQVRREPKIEKVELVPSKPVEHRPSEARPAFRKKPPKLVQFHGTGGRKTANARVWLTAGTGKYLINGKPLESLTYGRKLLYNMAMQPFVLTDTVGKYDIAANVSGGGYCSQIGAVMQALSKAISLANPDLRGTLRRSGLLTRDPRVKERKKYGQKKARKRFQYSKR